MFYHLKGPITLRRGDAVYVRAENGKNLIAQIDAMWTAADGMAYFHGPWFVTPKETPHPPNQMFYLREAFISTIQVCIYIFKKILNIFFQKNSTNSRCFFTLCYT